MRRPGSVMSRRGSLTSCRGSVMSRGGSVMSRRGSVMSRRGSVTSRRGSLTSRRGSVMSRRGSLTSRRGSVMSTRGSPLDALHSPVIPRRLLLVTTSARRRPARGVGGWGSGRAPRPSLWSLDCVSGARLRAERARMLHGRIATQTNHASISGFAEREGFEPSVPLPVHMISNHAPSTTRSSLQESLAERGLSGERGIRTHGTLTGTPDFESGTFGHSVSSPPRNLQGPQRIVKRARRRRPRTRPCPDAERRVQP
jgi:hypothetical protein